MPTRSNAPRSIGSIGCGASSPRGPSPRRSRRSGAVLLLRAMVRGERRDDVADPPEHAAGADPHPRRDDQPEDAAQEIAVVELADARDDRAEHRGGAWMT